MPTITAPNSCLFRFTCLVFGQVFLLCSFSALGQVGKLIKQHSDRRVPAAKTSAKPQEKLPPDLFKKGDSLFQAGNRQAALTWYLAKAVQAEATEKQLQGIGAHRQSIREALDMKVAECYLQLGQLAKADAISERLMKEALLDPGSDSGALGDALFMAGLTDMYKGRGQDADALLQHALSIYTHKYGQMHERSALVYNYLGLNAWDGQNLEQAQAYHRQALAVRTAALGPFSPEAGASCNNLGLVFQQSMPDTALYYFTRADRIFKEHYRSGHPVRLYTGINQAIVHNTLGNHKLAEAELELLLKDIKANLGPKHPSAGFVFATQCGFLCARADYERAHGAANAAIKIYTDAYGSRHPEIASLHLQLAEIAESQNRHSDALDQVQQAVVSNSSGFGSGNLYKNPTVEQALNPNLMIALLRRKSTLLEQQYSTKTLKQADLESALACLYLADSLTERLRRQRTDKADKLALAETGAAIYENAVRLCMQLAQVTIKPAYYREQAFYFSERSKAALLLSSIAEAAARRFAGIPDSLLKSEADLEAEVNLLEQQAASAVSAEALAQTRGRLFAANLACQKLVRRLEHTYPAYYNLKYRRSTPTVSEIRKSLDDSTALISYFAAPAEQKLYVFLLSHKAFKILVQEMDKNFSHEVTGMRNSILYFEQETYVQNAAKLFKLLMPFRLPKKINNLVFIPDGELLRLPFEALLTKSPAKTDESAKLHYLVEDYAVSYHYSAALYLQPDRRTVAEGAGLLAFAPTEFTGYKGGVSLPSLQASGPETDRIASGFTASGLPALTFGHGEATESAFKKSKLDKFAYIHMATHGVVDEEKPELSRVYLRPDPPREDGMLYTGEMYNLKLNARLVTLSACETGLGKQIHGEGLVGLGRALLYAGAQNVLVSLWSVGDAGTQELMVGLYANPASLGKERLSKPLRRAKLNLIAGGKFSAPFYWAPFVLVGR